MTPAEWVDILDLIADLWPVRKPWPDRAADRCYRQLRPFKFHTVQDAVRRHAGIHPPSPASLEAAVAEIAAYEYRYPDALPDISRDRSAVDIAVRQMRGDQSWDEWLKAQT